jgi:hypothetical protein
VSYVSLRLPVERTGKVNDPDAREISLAAQVGDRNLGSARRWTTRSLKRLSESIAVTALRCRRRH